MATTDEKIALTAGKEASSDHQIPICARIDKPSFSASAVYAGEHIDLRPFTRSKRIVAQQPAVVAVPGGGIAMLYRYGAVVFFDVSPTRQRKFLEGLGPHIQVPYANPETEDVRVDISDEPPESEIGGIVVLKCCSIERMQIVAAVLSKSVALAQYESDVAVNIERIEPFAVKLEQFGRGGRNMRLLLRHIGRALLDELKMVARVEVVDRPDLIWDHPDLEQLYLHLEDSFELQERASILDRKIELISRTVETVLDLLQKRRSVRVEWYIVILIVIELALSMYDLFMRVS